MNNVIQVGAMRKRELEEVDGPIEWWWWLAVMRYRGIRKASEILISETIDDKILNGGLISFRNPSLKEGTKSHYSRSILEGPYRQPTELVVSLKVKRSAKHEGLAFSFSDAKFKGRFVSRLIELAVSV
jgi:hypothetical protein